MYSLLDSIVDYYFLVQENIGEKLEDLETELMERPTTLSLSKLHELRKEMLGIRRSV